MAELTFTANDRAATALTLFGASGYDVLDLGVSPQAPSIEYSGQRGTLGKRPTASVQDNRALSMTVRTTATSKDVMATRLEALFDVLRLMNDHGGTVTWQSSGQTYRQHAIVLAASAGELPWTKTAENHIAADVQVVFTAAPFLEGDPLDIEDSFDTDSESDYTADAGSLSNYTFGSGAITPTGGLTAELRAIQTDRGYTYGDHEATGEFLVGATLASYKAGVILKRTASDTYLSVFVDDNGTNSRMNIEAIVAGVTEASVTTNLSTRLTASRRVWVRGRVEQGVAIIEVWHWNNPEWNFRDPDETEHLSVGAHFAPSTEGQAGLVFIPQAASSLVYNLAVRPYSYGNATGITSGGAANSGERGCQLFGSIPGDAPAKVETVVRWDQISAGSTHLRHALLAWSRRPSAYSYVANGVFSDRQGDDGWGVSAVANITAAATSINRVTTDAKFGNGCGQVVATATVDSGATYKMPFTFRVGVPYTAEAWVRSAADTDDIEIVLGMTTVGDQENSTAVALSTSWQKISVTWVPEGTGGNELNYDLAFVGIRAADTGAPTFQIDGVRVYQGATEPAEADRELAMAPRPPFGFYDALAEGTGGNAPDTGSGHAEVADTDAEGATYNQLDSSVLAAGETENISLWIGPHLVDEDALADGDALLEIWARLFVNSAFTGGVSASAAYISGSLADPVWGLEHGSTGRSLTLDDNWIISRIDTVPIPAGPKRGPMSGYISLTFTVAAGTNLQPIGVDWVLLCNPSRRVSTPTGAAASDLAIFRPDISTALDYATRVRVAPDLSAITESSAQRSPSPGLGGPMVEFPPGDVDAVFIASTEVPDSGAAAAEDIRHPPDLHFAVTPRWHLLRP